MANDISDEVLRRLDMIIALLATQTMPDRGTSDRAAVLRATGMDTALIARVLHTTPGTVRAADAAAKKKPARNGRAK